MSPSFEGPPERKEQFPSADVLKRNILQKLQEAEALIASHEPSNKKTHDAFTELSGRMEECSGVVGGIDEAQERHAPQEEMSLIVQGGHQSYQELVKAYDKAKSESQK